MAEHLDHSSSHIRDCASVRSHRSFIITSEPPIGREEFKGELVPSAKSNNFEVEL